MHGRKGEKEEDDAAMIRKVSASSSSCVGSLWMLMRIGGRKQESYTLS